jgi:hypothetical protein
MTTSKPLRNLSDNPASYLSIAVVLLAGAIRVPPLLIEQILPVVLGFLVRLPFLSVFAGKQLGHVHEDSRARVARALSVGWWRERHLHGLQRASRARGPRNHEKGIGVRHKC